MPESLSISTADRSQEILRSYVDANNLRTNKMFAGLLVFQWLACILAAFWLSPLTWHGGSCSIHPHVWMAVILGGLTMAVPISMTILYPHHFLTRHVVAVAQMLFSALLIDISGGRIETHFHVFGSLAFLAFYRDWKVLVTGSIVVAVDHLLGGWLAPQAVYGTVIASPLRTLEHSLWVVFTDCFLIYSCIKSHNEMSEIAEQRAVLEATNTIIEQKVAEQVEELSRRERQTQTIMDTAVDPIFSIAGDGSIELANKAAATTLGFSTSQLTKMNFADIVSLLDADGNPLSFAKYMEYRKQTSSGSRHEHMASRADCERISVELSVGAPETDGHKLYTCILHDISDRKQAERRVNEFYSTISHELRSPLTSIRGALSLIEGGNFGAVPPAALELVSIASVSTKRLIRLINDILDLRKIEAGKMDLNISRFDIDDLLWQPVQELRASAEKAGVTCRIFSLVKGSVQGDRDRLVQVLTNFLSNAIKFAPQGSCISVTAQPAGNKSVRISVTDRGCGIAESDFDKLFNKFQQVDSSDSRNSEGTGLGLAICKALIEQHHGQIGFTSKIGMGSTFWFEVPCPDTAAVPLAPISMVVSDAKKTVLLVEDDADVSAVLSAFLRNEGYNCLHAPSLAEAEKILMTVLPSAMIMDLVLPDGDGLELIDKLQSGSETRDIPVVVLTGTDRKNDNCRSMVIDWLHKPFVDEELLAAVNRAIECGPKPTVLIVDDDAQTRKIITKQIAAMGAVCIEACDGAEALSMVRTRKPDLMILDVMMPRPDGYEVVDILRKNDQNLRLIVHSAHDLSENDRNRLSLGLTRCISKASRDERELLHAVKELLGSSEDHTIEVPGPTEVATATG